MSETKDKAREWWIGIYNRGHIRRLMDYKPTDGNELYSAEELFAVVEKRAFEAMRERAEVAENELFFLLGIGYDAPISILGDKSFIQWLHEFGPKGAQELTGIERRCYGEPQAFITKLVDHFTSELVDQHKKNKDLEAKVKRLREALSNIANREWRKVGHGYTTADRNEASISCARRALAETEGK